MDTHRMAYEYLLTLPCVQDWPEMQTLLLRIATGKPRHWQLPVMACQAVGGSPAQVLPAVAAVACLHISIILIDDMLDADPRGEHRRLGLPATANLAAALQAAGLAAVVQGDGGPGMKLPILASLNRMMLVTALGQHRDLQNPQDEDTYWRVVRTKSAPFFGTALYIGALAGGASEETAAQIQQLGHLYGEMIQIHDDLNDVFTASAGPDWREGRSPLPILYAQLVPHPDRERFVKLRRQVRDPQLLAEAQAILIRCGAVSYAFDQLVRRYREAQIALQGITLARRDKLEELLEAVVRPMECLLDAAGVSEPEALLRSTGNRAKLTL